MGVAGKGERAADRLLGRLGIIKPDRGPAGSVEDDAFVVLADRPPLADQIAQHPQRRAVANRSAPGRCRLARTSAAPLGARRASNRQVEDGSAPRRRASRPVPRSAIGGPADSRELGAGGTGDTENPQLGKSSSGSRPLGVAMPLLVHCCSQTTDRAVNHRPTRNNRAPFGSPQALQEKACRSAARQTHLWPTASRWAGPARRGDG